MLCRGLSVRDDESQSGSGSDNVNDSGSGDDYGDKAAKDHIKRYGGWVSRRDVTDHDLSL